MHVRTHREKYQRDSSHKSWAVSPLGKRGTKGKRDREIGTERDKYSHRAGQIETESGRETERKRQRNRDPCRERK